MASMITPSLAAQHHPDSSAGKRKDTLMICQKNRKKSLLLLACALGFLLLHTQQAQALDGNAPIIIAITPGNGAAGFGQLVTIQGFNIYNPLNPALTQVTFTQGGIPANAFVFSSPSNP